jgi:hypothetical protein
VPPALTSYSHPASDKGFRVVRSGLEGSEANADISVLTDPCKNLSLLLKIPERLLNPCTILSINPKRINAGDEHHSTVIDPGWKSAFAQIQAHQRTKIPALLMRVPTPQQQPAAARRDRQRAKWQSKFVKALPASLPLGSKARPRERGLPPLPLAEGPRQSGRWSPEAARRRHRGEMLRRRPGEAPVLYRANCSQTWKKAVAD